MAITAILDTLHINTCVRILPDFISYLFLCSVYFIAHNTSVIVTTTFTYLAVKVGLNSGSPREEDFNSFTKKAEQFTYGLDKNIKLPETSKFGFTLVFGQRLNELKNLLDVLCPSSHLWSCAGFRVHSSWCDFVVSLSTWYIVILWGSTSLFDKHWGLLCSLKHVKKTKDYHSLVCA